MESAQEAQAEAHALSRNGCRRFLSSRMEKRCDPIAFLIHFATGSEAFFISGGSQVRGIDTVANPKMWVAARFNRSGRAGLCSKVVSFVQ
jgi:hypothetical protein